MSYTAVQKTKVAEALKMLRPADYMIAEDSAWIHPNNRTNGEHELAINQYGAGIKSFLQNQEHWREHNVGNYLHVLQVAWMEPFKWIGNTHQQGTDQEVQKSQDAMAIFCDEYIYEYYSRDPIKIESVIEFLEVAYLPDMRRRLEKEKNGGLPKGDEREVCKKLNAFIYVLTERLKDHTRVGA